MLETIIAFVRDVGLPATVVIYFLIKDYRQGSAQIKAFTQLCVSLTNYHDQVKDKLADMQDSVKQLQNDVTVCKTLLRDRGDGND